MMSQGVISQMTRLAEARLARNSINYFKTLLWRLGVLDEVLSRLTGVPKIPSVNEKENAVTPLVLPHLSLSENIAPNYYHYYYYYYYYY